MWDTVIIFLKSISLNHSNERFVYIFLTCSRIPSARAASLASFFGGRKAYCISFGEKVSKL